MKLYIGARTPDGETRVVVNEGRGPRPLAKRLEVRNHSPTGFEWGYGGSGPAQLALAILCEHFDHNTTEALKFYMEFKFQVVSAIKSDEWVLNSNEIEKALDKIRGRSV